MFKGLTGDRNGSARSVRISSERRLAGADGNVIGDSTVRVRPASSGTRIDAAVSRTALIPRTVRIENTFRSTGTVRIAGIVFGTDAIDCAVLFPALSIRSARIGIARA